MSAAATAAAQSVGPAAGTPAVELRDVTFGWPGKPPLLRIAAFDLARAERVFLRGPSGSGKSTLLGLVGGVLVPQSGRVALLGTDIARLSGSARDAFRSEHLGFIFQMFNLIPYLSVLENVLLPLQFAPARAHQLTGAALRDEARRLLATLGLGEAGVLSRSVTQLSIGQQQRVAAARALLGRPEIIVADEPTSSLDHDARETFLKLLMQECRQQGTALLFVSHDTSLGPMFDRVVSLAEINQAAAQPTD